MGAISVHDINGAWGTLAAPAFSIWGDFRQNYRVQILGIVSCFVWTFTLAFIMFKVIDETIGLRVYPEEEGEGLDLSEHGGNPYPDFEVSMYTQESPEVISYTFWPGFILGHLMLQC